MKQLLTLAAATLMLVACGDNPTAPVQAAPRMTPSALRLSAESGPARSELTLTISDVRERLIPLLENAAAAERLGALMTQTQAVVDQGDLDEAHRLLLDAQAVTDPNGDGTSAELGDPADVAVLRLTIENLAAATKS